MADYTIRTISSKVRIAYVLPNPTNWAEVQKVMSAIRTATKDYRFADYDDFVTVTSDDEEIMFSYEEER